MEIQQPIGIFDSGLGGISVFRSVAALLPQEDYIYYGDSGNAPYGVRPAEEIRALTVRALESLIQRGVKAIVIACNTASSAAGSAIRQAYPQLPIIAIEPALKPAVLSCPKGNVLVMATTATLQEAKFQRLMESYRDQANILKCPCPGLMEFVERGELDSPALEHFLRERFREFEGRKMDAIVLGCTHYPFLQPMIQKVAGPQVKVFDGAPGTARQLRRRLKAASLLKPAGPRGHITWLNSSPDARLLELSRQLFEVR